MVDRFINPNKTENGDTFEGGFDTLKKYRKASDILDMLMIFFKKKLKSIDILHNIMIFFKKKLKSM